MMEAIATSLGITPAQHLAAACHGPRDVPSARVAVPLEANVLGLRENGQVLIVVSVDWFYASPGLRERILSQCAGRLDGAGLVVAASHVHTSPNPDRTKIGFSKVDLEYVAWAEDVIADRVEELLRKGEWHPARLRFTSQACDCAIHRRRKAWSLGRSGFRRAVSIFPNAAGPRDRKLRMLRVEKQDGSLLAVMWGVSCHPTEWPRYGELSSDYPGCVRQAIRMRLGAEVPVIFLQGFCGDLRPPSIGRWPRRGTWRGLVMTFVSVVLNGRSFVGFTAREYARWMANIVKSAEEALNQAGHAPPLATKLSIRRSAVDLSALGISGEIGQVTFHWFDLDEELRVVGISAEVCWEYAGLIESAFPGKTIWPVGYIDSVYGYLPTKAMLAEGGYEVSGFMRPFGIEGSFVADIDETIIKSLS
jgi:hypothetical protein